MRSEDIAKLAGVSRSTVSRVINNYPNVPEETREKVMKIVREYNYSPNAFARTLAGKGTNTIGVFLFMEDWEKEEERISKNDFYKSYLELLVDYANLKDYYVLVRIISGKDMYRRVHQAFMEKRIDAGIIIGTQVDTLKEIHMDEIKSRVVLFDYDMTDEDHEHIVGGTVSTINSMDKEGIKKAVNYLYSLGHEKIGFIMGKPEVRAGRLRYEGYRAAMTELGLNINPKHVISGDFSMDKAYHEIKKMLSGASELPTAIISANDFMALSAMKALGEAGLSVPDDISLVGFDNTLHSEMSSPKLTTLSPDFRSMAEKAIDILDQQINEDTAEMHISYEVNFHKRESCKSINSGGNK